MARFTSFSDVTTDKMQAQVQLNLLSPYLLTPRLLPLLVSAQGSVINISSTSAHRLHRGLPKVPGPLERRLNLTLTGHLPRRMRRRSWNVAIDSHLKPYYGKPNHSPNELDHGQANAGTTTFPVYATACIVERGEVEQRG